MAFMSEIRDTFCLRNPGWNNEDGERRQVESGLMLSFARVLLWYRGYLESVLDSRGLAEVWAWKHMNSIVNIECFDLWPGPLVTTFIVTVSRQSGITPCQ